MVVAASPNLLARLAPGRTRAVVNAALTPTAGFVLDRDFDLHEDAMARALAAALGAAPDTVDATRLATALLGDAIGTNLLMLGYAFQKGWIPLGLDAILRAIELNGVAVEASRQAFAWGRIAAHDRAIAHDAAGISAATAAPPADLTALIDRHAHLLAQYQDERYARRYRDALAPLIEAERRCGAADHALVETAARSLFHLMAYKDEYEVARLYTDGEFQRALAAQFDGELSIRLHLAPPLLARRDPATGRARKIAFGPWMLGPMRVLARLRRLRGTPLDPFGRTAERRLERALIGEFEALLADVASALTPANHASAVALVAVPRDIRGFGPVKAASVEPARARMRELLAAMRGTDAAQAPAAGRRAA
jgi:indolepyruvate ferredoxin oxidoreductase